MNPRVRQRGSAYLYVIVCLVVMGGLLTELIPYVTQVRNLQARRARKLRADFATESLVQQVTAEINVQPIVNGSVRTLTLNNATATVTISDGSAVVANSEYLTGTTTTTDGQTFRFVRYITAGVGATPYNFAVYSPNDMNWAGKLITGANNADGDVFCNGNINLSTVSGTTINGNISAKGTVKLSGGTVTGNTFEKANALAMPSFSALNYQSNASYVLTGPQTFTGGVTFGGMTNGHYAIDYVNGDVNFQGAISGQGVVFVNGNITFTGNCTYANSSSRVAVICTGNLTIAAGCSQAVGVFYVGGSLVVNSPDFNMTKGSIIATTIAGGPIIRATRDNFMQTSSTEGTKLCLPGYWP